jgi:hypothetical protein
MKPKGEQVIAIEYVRLKLAEYESRLEASREPLETTIDELINSTVVDELKAILKLLEQETPEAHLKRAQAMAIERAKEYRKKHGDPVDNLANLLGNVIQDEEIWRQILDSPYG